MCGIDRDGKKILTQTCRAHVLRDKSEWIETPMPHLRIIEEELWERVKTRRLGVSQGVAALRASLHCHARSTGPNPKYLFSGLLVCRAVRRKIRYLRKDEIWL